MSDYLKPWYCAFVAITIVVGLMVGSVSQVCAGNSSPIVMRPYTEPIGKTYGEWSERFLQWNYSFPLDQHPLFEDGDVDCSKGQKGNVWFLGGTFTVVGDETEVRGEADRNCSIPVGKALFFPIINAECNEIVDGTGDEGVLRECANFLADHIQELKVTVDGEEIEHFGLYRAESPLFTIGPLPENNILGVSSRDTAPSVGDGFYVMLAPLSEGEHDIHFEGAAVFTVEEDGFEFRFELDIDYHITVGK